MTSKPRRPSAHPLRTTKSDVGRAKSIAASVLSQAPNPPRDRATVARDVLSPRGFNQALSDRISQVRDGLPIAELDQVARLLTISREQLAYILGITVRTLQRKAEADDRLGPAASDRLARVRRIHDLATHVLGEQEKASRWMTSASRPLGGQLPLQLLDTDIGTKRVEQELYQIKYSIPA